MKNLNCSKCATFWMAVALMTIPALTAEAYQIPPDVKVTYVNGDLIVRFSKADDPNATAPYYAQITPAVVIDQPTSTSIRVTGLASNYTTVNGRRSVTFRVPTDDLIVDMYKGDVTVRGVNLGRGDDIRVEGTWVDLIDCDAGNMSHSDIVATASSRLLIDSCSAKRDVQATASEVCAVGVVVGNDMIADGSRVDVSAAIVGDEMIVLALSNADLDGVICDDLKVGLGGWSNYAGFVNAVAMVSNCTANYVQFTGDKGTEGIYEGKGNSFKIMWNMTYLIDWIKLM